MIDLDDFKNINDTYGHVSGDSCLVSTAKNLVKYFGDCVYRTGGDEFAVIVQTTGDEFAQKLDSVNDELENNKIALQISVGAYTVKDGDEPEKALVYADRALYRAKIMLFVFMVQMQIKKWGCCI